MPRNLKGGKSHKKLASKNSKQNTSFIKVRYKDINEPCEIYARVLSVYGGGMLEVYCDDGVKRLCVIRRKFKGRNKKKNWTNDWNINTMLEMTDDKPKKPIGLPNWPPKGPSPSELPPPVFPSPMKPHNSPLSPVKFTDEDMEGLGAATTAVQALCNTSMGILYGHRALMTSVLAIGWLLGTLKAE